MRQPDIMSGCLIKRPKLWQCSLPADVLWGSFVTHSFLPHGRNECVTNEPQGTSAGRLLAMTFLKEQSELFSIFFGTIMASFIHCRKMLRVKLSDSWRQLVCSYSFYG